MDAMDTISLAAMGSGLSESSMRSAARMSLATYAVSVVSIVNFIHSNTWADPVLIVAALGLLFTGIVLMQWSNYVWNTREEPKLLRALATLVTLSNVVQFGFDTAFLHIQGSAGLDSPFNLLRPQRMAAMQNAATLITVVSAQYYFSNIVLKSTHSNRIWSALSSVLMVTTIVGGIGSVWAFLHIAGEGSSSPPQLFTGAELAFFCLWLGSSAHNPVYEAFSAKKKSEFGPTSDVLSYLLVSTLETFSLTAGTALTALLLTAIPYTLSGIAVLRCNLGNTVCTMLLGRFSAICFLYTLNRRAPLRARFEQSRNHSGEAQRNRIYDANTRNKFGGMRFAANGVKIQTEIITSTDHSDKDLYGKESEPNPTQTFTVATSGTATGDYPPPSKHSEKAQADILAAFDQRSSTP